MANRRRRRREDSGVSRVLYVLLVLVLLVGMGCLFYYSRSQSKERQEYIEKLESKEAGTKTFVTQVEETETETELESETESISEAEIETGGDTPEAFYSCFPTLKVQDGELALSDKIEVAAGQDEYDSYDAWIVVGKDDALHD